MWLELIAAWDICLWFLIFNFQLVLVVHGFKHLLSNYTQDFDDDVSINII